MKKVSTCLGFSCNTVVDGAVAQCPRCGKKMRSSATMRTLGAVSIVLGIFLIGMMGTISYFMAPTMLSPGQTIDGNTWTGTAEQGRMALSIFAFVALFGLIALINGVWQVITGSRSRALLVIVLVLAVGLFAYARYTMDVFEAAG